MDVSSVATVFFSPTGSTKRVVSAIAAGMAATHVEPVDLTPFAVESEELPAITADACIVGVPVYAGRVPATAVRRISKLRAQGIPVILVVTYGNRAFEDALVELEDLVTELGMPVVAGAAFIGEHSYSTKDTPIAVGRPAIHDLESAASFGASVAEILHGVANRAGLKQPAIPGNRPYRDVPSSGPIAPETDTEECGLCAYCATICPTGAITVSDHIETDAEACIKCCACVKSCPTMARSMTAPRIDTIRSWLVENFSEPQEPQVFLS